MDDELWWPICGLIMLGYAVGAFVDGNVFAGFACLSVASQFARLTWAVLRDAGVVGRDDPPALED